MSKKSKPLKFNQKEYGYDLKNNADYYGSYEIREELIKTNQNFEGYRCVAYHISFNGKETKISDRLFLVSHDAEDTVQKHFEQQILTNYKKLIEPYLLNY